MNKDLQLAFEEIERLNNIIIELETYIKSYLYMLNGVIDDDFTLIMEKLQELKGSE